MSFGGIESAAVVTAVGTPAAVAASKSASPETKIYGTYEEGYWFDRELFSVWVVADTPGEAEQVARETASNSCATRGGSIKVDRFKAWQERRLFIPVKINRFSFEMQFRCSGEDTILPSTNVVPGSTHN